MSAVRRAAVSVISIALAVPAMQVTAQSLAARVDAAPAGHVQFSFAARPGVCGNGRTYIQTAPGSYQGSFYISTAETLRNDPCEPGPVRVILDRAAPQINAVQTYVGPETAVAVIPAVYRGS